MQRFRVWSDHAKHSIPPPESPGTGHAGAFVFSSTVSPVIPKAGSV